MGHEWKDICPKEAAAHDRYLCRIQKLREDLGRVPLSEFKVKDIYILHNLYNLGRGSLSDRDLRHLERISRRISKAAKK